jgi:hypothetical protein
MDDLARLRYKLLQLSHGQVLPAMEMEQYIFGPEPFEDEEPDPKVKDDIPEEGPEAVTQVKAPVVNLVTRKTG